MAVLFVLARFVVNIIQVNRAKIKGFVWRAIKNTKHLAPCSLVMIFNAKYYS